MHRPEIETKRHERHRNGRASGSPQARTRKLAAFERAAKEQFRTAMFFARRPSLQAIERFSVRALEMPLSYNPLGIAREPSKANTTGYDINRYRTLISHAESGGGVPLN
jgi:hypothetical protein